MANRVANQTLEIKKAFGPTRSLIRRRKTDGRARLNPRLDEIAPQQAITEQIGRKIRARGLVPETEKNDSLILAEAALAGVTLLLSSDSHLKDIDLTILNLLLKECDVSTLLIASPAKVVKGFFK